MTTGKPFYELWQQMTPEERKAARVEMESAAIEQMPRDFLLAHTEAKIHRAAKQQINALIDHCKRTA